MNHPEHPHCLVRLDRVCVRFGERCVFSDLSLRLFRGEHLALLGGNGAGKSTLLRLLAGELRPAPSGGDGIRWNFEGAEESFVPFAHKYVRLLSAEGQRRYMRQGWRISGEEVLLSGLDNALYADAVSESAHARAGELAAAAGAEALLSMTVPEMSQGQLRLALFLRALMGMTERSGLLLLDEPFDGLDAASRDRIGVCLDLAASRGSTVLVSAHREEDIPPFVRDALCLRGGAITRVAREGCSSRQAGRDPVPALPRESRAHNSARSGGEPALVELEHVDVFTNREHVLFDITWSVRAGERWVLSGANGSGKSTLLRLLYGEEFAAYGGRLRWRGAPRPALETLRAEVGYVSDRLQYLYDYDISAEEVVVSGLRGTVGLYHEPREHERELARFWLENMGLLDQRSRPLHSLSSGTARRVLLARALAASPALLLLDEPCSGLDERSRERFSHSLALLAEQGVSMVHVSHHERDKTSLFTHELRLDRGRVSFCAVFP